MTMSDDQHVVIDDDDDDNSPLWSALAEAALERRRRLQPSRMKGTQKELESWGYVVTRVNDTLLTFVHEGHPVMFWPYTGWHSGKSIKMGRGFENLITQLLSDLFDPESDEPFREPDQVLRRSKTLQDYLT
jgi:hypothetical protein